MLIKEIINGISQKIYGFYEGLYDIYVEDVEQGLQIPCFMINLISSDIRMILKPRYKFESVFDVIYFGEGYKDCVDRGSELYDILEYITIKGFKRKGSIDPKGEDFKYNQTIRVIDQIGNDIAVIFNTQFLGKIPNDKSGRAALWNELVKYHERLQGVRAIENFSSNDITVIEGDTKRSVVVNKAITPINCMTQLYMVCRIA